MGAEAYGPAIVPESLRDAVWAILEEGYLGDGRYDLSAKVVDRVCLEVSDRLGLPLPMFQYRLPAS